jgi:transposase IS66 family protein
LIDGGNERLRIIFHFTVLNKLPRSILAEWVGCTIVTLQPLANRLTWHLLQGNTLHADETPIAQLDPDKGKTHKACLWAYRSNDLEPGPRIIIFDYQAGRSSRHAQNSLENWQGHLLVDDYGGVRREVANIIVMPYYQGDMTNRSVGCSLPMRA